MAVLVKQFRVRYNGVTYGPGQPGGQIITGLSEEEEARLIEGSNGAIVKYIPPQASGEELPDSENLDNAAQEGEDKTDSPVEEREGEAVASVGEVDPGPGLPAIDPADLIKPKKEKRR